MSTTIIILIVVCGLFLMGSLISGFFWYIKEERDAVTPMVFCAIFASAMFSLIIAETYKEIPAIEVYRGHTTLKVNGYQIDEVFVPEDSIVVVKPHFDNPALKDTANYQQYLLNK